MSFNFGFGKPNDEDKPFTVPQETGNGSFVEPNADQRQMAASIREIHNAFAFAGFTDDQAFQLTKTMIESGMRQGH